MSLAEIESEIKQLSPEELKHLHSALNVVLREKLEPVLAESSWREFGSGLEKDHDELRRIQSVIDDAFERIEPEDWR